MSDLLTDEVELSVSYDIRVGDRVRCKRWWLEICRLKCGPEVEALYSGNWTVTRIIAHRHALWTSVMLERGALRIAASPGQLEAA